MSVAEIEAELAALELELLEADALDAAREDLGAWCMYRHPEWTERPWFHATLADELQAWLEDPDDASVLVVTMPPGHAKSTYAREAVAWTLGRDPSKRCAYISYNADKAQAQAGQIMDALASDEFRAAFPGIRTKETADVAVKRAKETDRLVHLVSPDGHKLGGALLALGIQGGLNSERVDLIAIDDYLKGPDEARSVTTRTSHKQWYTRIADSRGRPGRPLKILIICTRWHIDDLVGWLQKEDPDSVRELRFEGLKEAEPGVLQDPRREGEALWPLMRTREQYLRTKRLDPEGHACINQGRPVPEGGALFKLTWMSGDRRWDVLPDVEGRWLQSWDFRHGGRGSSTSYAVGQLWFKPHDRAVAYLVDQVRGRWGPSESELQFELAQDRPNWSRAGMILIERKADGINIIDKYLDVYPGIVEVEPRADKLTRARAIVGFVRAGNVRYPMHALWMPEFLGEVTTFTGHGDATDDQVDAKSQALEELFMGEHGRAATADEIVEMQTQMLEELEGLSW
jgi:predicted phage terminase large subunit-like protein